MDKIVLRKHQPYSGIIRGSSYITDIFPASGRIIDTIFYGLGRTSAIATLAFRLEAFKMHSVRNFSRILVVSDLNIGDAVLTQSVISGIRDYLPYARVDYLFTSSAAKLVKNNPEISTEYPLLTGRPFPNIYDLRKLNSVITENRYDLVINFCPLFNGKADFGKVTVIEGYLVVGPQILHDENSREAVTNVAWQSNRFVRNLLDPFLVPVRNHIFKGVSIHIGENDYSKAMQILSDTKLYEKRKPVILFNPDASSPFTAIPVENQVAIVHQLARKEYNIMLGCGYTLKGIETHIMNSLPGWLAGRITLLPHSLSLAEIAALTDLCDLYIGGDTGPLHIAAAQKRTSGTNISFNNKTAVFSIFGATPERVYGYDSVRPGFLAANQDTLSRVYSAKSQCKNITCADKKNKVCRVVRCFENLNTDEIVNDISEYLKNNPEKRNF
jgi:heptosyltransferase II